MLITIRHARAYKKKYASGWYSAAMVFAINTPMTVFIETLQRYLAIGELLDYAQK